MPAVAWWRSASSRRRLLGRLRLTRPLGASFADWFGKPRQTGLGLGDGTVCGDRVGPFVALVAYAAIRKDDIQDGGDPPGPDSGSGGSRERTRLKRPATRPVLRPQPSEG